MDEHWEVEQLLTHEELRSPPGTPSEWWRVTPNVNRHMDEAEAVELERLWHERFPGRATRVVKIVIMKAYRIDGKWTTE